MGERGVLVDLEIIAAFVMEPSAGPRPMVPGPRGKALIMFVSDRRRTSYLHKQALR